MNHIEIYVSQLERTRTFYDVLFPQLGYVLYREWQHGFSYKKGNWYIVFVQAEEKYLDIRYHRCRVGLNHLAFSIASRQELDSLRQLLIEKEVPLLYDQDYPRARGIETDSLFFEDPDRMKIEVNVSL